MKIKIDIKNNEAINAALEAVNGKATSFTITSAKEVLDAVKAVETKLAVLPKAERKGAKAHYRPTGPSASSYKYMAKTTRITIERGATDWFLTGVFSEGVLPKASERMIISISKAQADEIQRRAIADFNIFA